MLLDFFSAVELLVWHQRAHPLKSFPDTPVVVVLVVVEDVF